MAAKSRKAGVLTFAVISVLWIVVILHGTLGFVEPKDGHAKLVDAVHAVVWIVFLLAAWRLYSSLVRRVRNKG